MAQRIGNTESEEVKIQEQLATAQQKLDSLSRIKPTTWEGHQTLIGVVFAVVELKGQTNKGLHAAHELYLRLQPRPLDALKLIR